MKFLVFDTETGGTNEHDNDILQLSYLITEDGKTTKEVNLFFDYPEDESRVCEGAINVNGLTKEVLAEHGTTSRTEGIKQFYKDAKDADWLIAHNGNFDRKFIVATAIREGLSDELNWDNLIDTMKSTTNLVKIPSKWGYKYPKLSELANFLNIDYSDLNLHDSLSDVKLTLRCFEKLLVEHKEIF